MNLSQSDFNNRLFFGSIRDRFYFNGTEVFKLNNNLFYKRRDHYLLGLPLLYQEVGLYLVKGNLVLRIYHNSTYTYVVEANVIESRMQEPFTGFELGKVYNLINGQSWRQTSGLHAPSHHSSGYVKILENRIKVDSWDFYPQVERIK